MTFEKKIKQKSAFCSLMSFETLFLPTFGEISHFTELVWSSVFVTGRRG